MGQKKGAIPWNKGIKTNQIPWNKGIKSWVKPWLGKKRSFETIEKIRAKRTGTSVSSQTEFKLGNPPPQHKKDCKCFRCDKKIGNKNHKYLLDRTMLQRCSDIYKDRGSSVHRNWSITVKNRDNFQCKISNQECNGRIEAHHILSYTKFPELRYEINNGITLCHTHHPRKRDDEVILAPVFQKMVQSILAN